MTAGDATPMMAQYLRLKAEAGDCLLFYRMGDFFELFFEDAEVASGVLDIALTARGEHAGRKVPMCGVPVHAADAYLAKLIRAGHRVAIADQVETPQAARARGGKTLVERAIVRVVTAGTLTEEALLDARAANWLVALAPGGGEIGIGAADISTGRMELSAVPPDALGAELARLAAAEILVPEGWDAAPAGAIPRPRAAFDRARGEARLRAIHGVATLDGFGSFEPAALAAAGGLLDYLDHAGKARLPFLAPPVAVSSTGFMVMDPATRESLEIIAAAGGGRAGSLLATVDRTVTAAGARRLAADLSQPLADRHAIEAQLALVGWLVEEDALRDRLRRSLRHAPDLARAVSRLAAGRGTPRDLGQLRDGLTEARALHDRLGSLAPLPRLLDTLLPDLAGHGALTDQLTRALVPQPPLDAAAGGAIAEGFDEALDALRTAAGAGRRAIAALETRYREETGIAALRIRHNAVIGYHLEVPARHADKLLVPGSTFIHRQTMAGAVRFSEAALAEEAARVAHAGQHALAAEAAHLETLTRAAVAAAPAIARTADALARIDVAAANAERAREGGWVRPIFVDQPCLAVSAARHPVVEAAVARTGGRFVPNDCQLGGEATTWLLTGPNMGGKSTFLRQNALVAVLAQAGCFVPAETARLGIVDRLFSRVGASDNLARGRSTFMVEMVETAAILQQATANSLVVLDEIGRGTSTYDGLAIAWAVLEAIAARRCRCLFATHYHELTRLAERVEGIANRHVRAREWKGELVLLHEVAPGPADRSYGIAVARLAGVPAPVLARARQVLGRLEAGRAKTGGLAAGLDDLPLFAAAAAAEPARDPLRDALAAADVDALAPRDALALIYRLKELLREDANG